jgi:DNA-binding IclR family transcriptional regulator
MTADSWCVARTMQALELLAFRPLSAPQLAAALQVHPRTARRLLTRLHHDGYLTRGDDARRLYSPSMRIVALAGQIVAHSPLTRTANPYVARLHEQTGAEAHLVVPSYLSALCVVHHESGTSAARPHPRELVPSHCTATGKALLSWRQPWRESVLSHPLGRYTQRTIIDAVALERDLADTRSRGYAVEDSEHKEGVRAVAAPVSLEGEVVAALGASGAGIAIQALAERVTTLADELTDAVWHADR